MDVPELRDEVRELRKVLPEAGEWRVSVGRPGEPRWVQEKGTVLTHGGPDRLRVTVPALGRVRFEFAHEGPERPRQVSAHAFDPEHAAAVMRSRMQGVSDSKMEFGDENPARGKGRDRAAEKAKLEAKRAAKEAEILAGTAKPARVEMSNSVKEVREEARNAGTRAPAFEPGWRMIKSARPDVNGVAELKDLPSGPGRLIVRHPTLGYAEVPVNLAAGELNKQEVTLDSGSLVYVTVLDAEGQPMAGVLCTALDERGAPLSYMWSLEESQATNQAYFSGGEQKLGPLPSGNYLIQMVRPGKPTARHVVAVDGREELHLRLPFSGGER